MSASIPANKIASAGNESLITYSTSGRGWPIDCRTKVSETIERSNYAAAYVTDERVFFVAVNCRCHYSFLLIHSPPSPQPRSAILPPAPMDGPVSIAGEPCPTEKRHQGLSNCLIMEAVLQSASVCVCVVSVCVCVCVPSSCHGDRRAGGSNQVDSVAFFFGVVLVNGFYRFSLFYGRVLVFLLFYWLRAPLMTSAPVRRSRD